jgi:VanZ family protein
MTEVQRRRERSIDGLLWILFISSCAATVWFSLIERPPGTDLFSLADKVQHAIACFAMTLTFLLAAVWRPGRGPGRWPSLSVPFCASVVLVGASIEILQSLNPARDAELSDVIAEAIGTVTAFAVFVLVRRWTTRRSLAVRAAR